MGGITPPTTKTIEDMNNKKIIRITSIEDYGRNHEIFCDKVLMLRYARRAGDTEVVNHTQLGALKRNPRSVKFEIVDDYTPMTINVPRDIALKHLRDTKAEFEAKAENAGTEVSAQIFRNFVNMIKTEINIIEDC